MHTSMLTHKVKGMQWVKEERNCVEHCLGAECITYMVPFNLHHGYIHWPSFYRWNTQSPEGLFSPGSCRARMRTWDWLDGKGHALCLSYYCYSKTSRSTAVRSGGALTVPLLIQNVSFLYRLKESWKSFSNFIIYKKMIAMILVIAWIWNLK